MIGNINEAAMYNCAVQNTVGGTTVTDIAKFFITVATVEDTNIEIFQGPAPIHVLKPNLVSVKIPHLNLE